jgi:glycosyltransferase involved in cell wall biosynthesis
VAFHNARALAGRGHEVVVLTSSSGVRRDQRPKTNSELRVAFMRTPVRLGNAPMCPELLWKLDRSFDIVHLHYPFIFGAEMAALAARCLGVALIVTVHNLPSDAVTPKRYLLDAYRASVQPVVIKSARRIIGVRRRHLFSSLPSLAADHRVRELTNGVDLYLFHPLPRDEARRTLGLPRGSSIALFVGSLDSAHRFKGVNMLIRAFMRVRIDDSYLVIVGSGNLLPECAATARAIGLGSRVRFFGEMRPEQLPAVYSAADVLVLPSTSVESFGLVALEAMACGTCAIVSDLPGVDEAVELGVDGFTVRHGNEEDLVQVLSYVLSHREVAAQMGMKGRLRVEQSYSWDSTGERLEDIYKEVLAEGRPTPRVGHPPVRSL